MRIFKNLYLYRTKQIKFFASSIIVTSTDYLLFFSFLKLFGPIFSNIISYSCALCLSFYLHKRFVFYIKRSISSAFIYIVIFSLVGISLSTLILIMYNYFINNLLIAKIFMTITMFFYNFYTKKLAFETNN